MFLSGLFLMSRYVAKFSFNGTVVTTRSRKRTSGTPAKVIQSVVSIVSPILFLFFPSLPSHIHFFFKQIHQSLVLVRFSAHQACPRPPSHLPPYPPRPHPQGTTRAQSWVASSVVLQQSPSPLPLSSFIYDDDDIHERRLSRLRASVHPSRPWMKSSH
jgi:hypothetical protein